MSSVSVDANFARQVADIQTRSGITYGNAGSSSVSAAGDALFAKQVAEIQARSASSFASNSLANNAYSYGTSYGNYGTSSGVVTQPAVLVGSQQFSGAIRLGRDSKKAAKSN